MPRRSSFALLASSLLVSSACSLQKTGTGDENISLGPDSAIEDSSSQTDSVILFDTELEDTTLPDTTVVDSGPDDTGADTLTMDVAPEAETGGDLGVTCTEIANGTDINLTTEGTAGWAHYGLIDAKSYNHKSSPDSISDLITSGGAAVRYPSFETSASWTDGAPTATTTATKTGLYLTAPGSAFTFTVTGDGTLHTLRFYIRVGSTDGRATLTLGAAKAVTILPKNMSTKTFSCSAALAWSSSLQVMLTEVGGGSLTLLAVTLQ